MNRAEKESFVAEFRDKVKAAPVMYLTDFTGLDVKSMTVLRQRLKASGAEYVVVKNRLAKRAIEELSVPDLGESLLGPTGVILGYQGAVEPAKAVADFAKEHDDKPVFKIGVLDDALVSPEEIQKLAKLPPREQLLAELAGAMESPLTALAGALEAKLQEMVGLLDALGKKRAEEGPVEATPAAEPAASADEEEVAEEVAEVEAEAGEAPEAEAEEAPEASEAEAGGASDSPDKD